MAQGMKESSSADPPLLLNQLVMHDCEVGAVPPKLIHPSLKQKRSAYPKDGRCGAATLLYRHSPGPKGKPSIKQSSKGCKPHDIITS
jgi:hypothetical protein